MKNFIYNTVLGVYLTLWTSIYVFILVIILTWVGVVKSAETVGWHDSITGHYRLIKATPWEVQNVWDSRSKLSIEVASFSDWKRKEIWYTSEASLRYEKWVVSSFQSLREGTRIDRRASHPRFNW